MSPTLDPYRRIAPFYDALDLPFERWRYCAARPLLSEGLGGRLRDERDCLKHFRRRIGEAALLDPGTLDAVDVEVAAYDRPRRRDCPRRRPARRGRPPDRRLCVVLMRSAFTQVSPSPRRRGEGRGEGQSCVAHVQPRPSEPGRFGGGERAPNWRCGDIFATGSSLDASSCVKSRSDLISPTLLAASCASSSKSTVASTLTARRTSDAMRRCATSDTGQFGCGTTRFSATWRVSWKC